MVDNYGDLGPRVFITSLRACPSFINEERIKGIRLDGVIVHPDGRIEDLPSNTPANVAHPIGANPNCDMDYLEMDHEASRAAGMSARCGLDSVGRQKIAIGLNLHYQEMLPFTSYPDQATSLVGLQLVCASVRSIPILPGGQLTEGGGVPPPKGPPDVVIEQRLGDKNDDKPDDEKGNRDPKSPGGKEGTDDEEADAASNPPVFPEPPGDLIIPQDAGSRSPYAIALSAARRPATARGLT